MIHIRWMSSVETSYSMGTMNKDDILRLTDRGMAIFKHYLPTPFRVGRNFLNPLYEDKHASCNIYYERRSDTYKMKDFGNDDYSGDCFAFVGKLNGLDCKDSKDFIQIMKIIDRDLHLGLSSGNYIETKTITPISPAVTAATSPSKVKKARPYTLAQKSFTAAELAFWGKSGITQEVLRLFRVVSLKKFSSENNEGKPFSIAATDKEPVFGYTAKQYVKVYRPHSEMRFLYAGDFGENYCFGLEQLPAKGDLLFITGSEKDVMSLTVHGFHAICFNSETVTIPVGIIHRLSFRFKHIVLLYDVDKAGLDSSAKQELALKNYGVKRLLLPLAGTKVEKDISDFFRLGNSREDLIKLFLDYLDTIYSETMSALKSCEVDFNNPPPVAQMVVSVNDVPLGTQGNILCITGGEGTGKSNYVTALIAGAIGQSEKNKDKVMDTYVQAFSTIAVNGGGIQFGEYSLYVRGYVVVLIGYLVQFIEIVQAFFVDFLAQFVLVTAVVEIFVKMILQVYLLPEFPVRFRSGYGNDTHLIRRNGFLYAIHFDGIVNVVAVFAGIVHFDNPADNDRGTGGRLLVLFCQFSFDGDVSA